MPRVILTSALLAAFLAPLPCSAALFPRKATASSRSSKITLRKRLHVNTLITSPGTMEVDWGDLYSFTTANFSMPSGLRYTPEGRHVLWGRTEYSVAFDTLTSADAGGSRVTQFTQALTFAGVTVLHDGEKLDVAFAPQASIFLRDESGARLGATAIARYDSGRNSTGVTVGWSAATHSSSTNPAGTVNAGFGYGRQLSGSRFLERLTPHVNGEWEKSTGQARNLLATEGVEYQITERLAFDLAGQHFAAPGSATDNQVAFGMTLNLGRMR